MFGFFDLHEMNIINSMVNNNIAAIWNVINVRLAPSQIDVLFSHFFNSFLLTDACSFITYKREFVHIRFSYPTDFCHCKKMLPDINVALARSFNLKVGPNNDNSDHFCFVLLCVLFKQCFF